MPKRSTTIARLVAIFIALGLIAAACGSDDTTSTATDDAPASTADSSTSDDTAPEDDAMEEADEAPETDDSTAPEVAAADWAPYPVEVWSVPFDSDSSRTTVNYEPTTATQNWNICVSIPHLQDAYWVGVDYGIVAEAERQGVTMTLVEAGGYTNLDTQISQIEDCVQGGADALIVGAIAFDGLNNVLDEVAADGIPVIDMINGVSTQNITAKSLVSFGEMGAEACGWLANHVGDEPTTIAWFPGPSGAGWVEAGDAGCQEALEGTSVEIIDTRFGDTGRDVQDTLVEDALSANPDIDFIVGTAVTAESAVSILRDRGLDEEIGVVSYYFSPGVFEGIQNERILASPTDSPVIQARVAVDQAIRALQGEPFEAHVGPELISVDGSSLDSFDPQSTLAPDGFDPVFNVGG